MIDLAYPRDLVMTAAIFGVAAFAWSGWAQERPPAGWVSRAALAMLGLVGIVMAAVAIPAAALTQQMLADILPRSGGAA